MKPIIRILRVLGGLSTLILLGRSYLSLTPPYIFIPLVICTIFVIYHLYISYHRFIHIYKVINSEQIKVRNSPLDRFASHFARLLLCAKGACENAQPVAGTLGLMLGVDEVLAAADKTPIFKPFLITMLGGTPSPPYERINQVKMDVERVFKFKDENKEASVLLQTVQNALHNDPTSEEIPQTIRDCIKRNQEERSKLGKKINDIIRENN